ncbi:MAG TPA: lipid-A-disaccharide synthase, partial [Cyclobacteriaceae bacterium]|nr:lipid-A-disaccharide synthase [Cyclobacteriaceae bacterium]
QRQPDAQFRGFGGDYMHDAGMHQVVHYRELAFMGFAEVLANLRTISKRIAQCKKDVLAYKPDVIVLIDYAGFNMRIAKFAKQHGLKVFWYISPKVWAWNQKRALKLKANVDRMFVILPFEKKFFKEFNWDVDYVGNPVLDAVKAHQPSVDFKLKHGLPASKIIALLPGSRQQELKKIIPLMSAVAANMQNIQFVVAAVDNLNPELYDALRILPNVKFVQDAYNLLTIADAAIVTSGTATLETALFRVPQVVVYKTSGLTYWIARLIIKVPFISLVNLVADKEVIKEMIQREASVERVSAEVKRILSDNAYRKEMLSEYDRIIRTLDTGSASENTARLMLR